MVVVVAAVVGGQSMVRVAAERDAIEDGSFVDRLWTLDALDRVLRHFGPNLVVLLVMCARVCDWAAFSHWSL